MNFFMCGIDIILLHIGEVFLNRGNKWVDLIQKKLHGLATLQKNVHIVSKV